MTFDELQGSPFAWRPVRTEHADSIFHANDGRPHLELPRAELRVCSGLPAAAYEHADVVVDRTLDEAADVGGTAAGAGCARCALRSTREIMRLRYECARMKACECTPNPSNAGARRVSTGRRREVL
jgi:hypothetical protein